VAIRTQPDEPGRKGPARQQTVIEGAMSAGRRAPGSPVSPLLHARLPLTALLLAVCGCVLVFAGLSELPPLLLPAAEAAT
jgi:hypothetical protein